MGLQHEEASPGKAKEANCANRLTVTSDVFAVTDSDSSGQDGYVDGADAGEEASLSVGFKVGFREGAAQTVVVGRLKGIVR